LKVTKAKNCCTPGVMGGSCCGVEAVVSVDERGQMVLPKETRDKANIRAGDKLALISWEKEGKICCLSLIKAESLTGMVKNMLGPLMEEIIKK
jgi:AbrB family looped-hinge helix DNA binding protein